MKRPLKIVSVLKKVQECIENGRYFDTTHAFMRKQERKVSLPEILYVLKHGYHEKKKDEFKEEHKNWNYAIRGKILDGRDLRIVVALNIFHYSALSLAASFWHLCSCFSQPCASHIVFEETCPNLLKNLHPSTKPSLMEYIL